MCSHTDTLMNNQPPHIQEEKKREETEHKKRTEERKKTRRWRMCVCVWVCMCVCVWFPLFEQEVPLMSVPVLISKEISVTASAKMATAIMVSRQMQENAFMGFYDYDEPDMGDMDSSAHLDYTSDLHEMREEDQLSFMALPDTFLDHSLSQVCMCVCVCVCVFVCTSH